jgi:hypothetical protein
MREIHLRLAAKAWLEQASRRSAEESLFRTSMISKVKGKARVFVPRSEGAG